MLFILTAPSVIPILYKISRDSLPALMPEPGGRDQSSTCEKANQKQKKKMSGLVTHYNRPLGRLLSHEVFFLLSGHKSGYPYIRSQESYAREHYDFSQDFPHETYETSHHHVECAMITNKLHDHRSK